MYRRHLIYMEKEYALVDLFKSVWDNFLNLREEILKLFKKYKDNPSDELKNTIMNICSVGIEQACDNYYLAYFLIIDPIAAHRYENRLNQIKEEFEEIVSELSKTNNNSK